MRSAILVGALLSAIASVAAADPPKPVSDLALIFNADSYPPAALRQAAEGKVGFAVEVSADGRVSGCRITQSSGNVDLDAGTCSLMMRLARFRPATDAAGRSVLGQWASAVNWTLPPKDEAPAMAAAPGPRTDPPNPQLVFNRREADGKGFVRYVFDVANKAAFPAELFKPSPSLPPCGANKNAARTWVDVFDDQGRRVHGFCGLSSPQQLNALWFATPEGKPPPPSVHIVMTDRLTRKTYASNKVSLRGLLPATSPSAASPSPQLAKERSAGLRDSAVVPATRSPATAACASEWSDQLVRSFGSQTGAGRIWAIHQPVALRMLGQDVPYVVVERDTVRWSVWYRLGELSVRDEFNQPLPASVHSAWSATYGQEPCEEAASSCSLRVDRNDASRWLAYVQLTNLRPPGRDLSGPGAGRVVADQELWRKGLTPIFLVCGYDTDASPAGTR